MGMVEGYMKMVNVHHLTLLQQAWVQGGRYHRTIRFKKGFPPELNFPQHGTKGGRGSVSSSNHRTLHRFPEHLTHSKALNCLEHWERMATKKVAHNYSERNPALASQPDLDTLVMKTGSESI